MPYSVKKVVKAAIISSDPTVDRAKCVIYTVLVFRGDEIANGGMRVSPAKKPRPAYVTDFKRPAGTEIRPVGNYWYLYKVKSHYDKVSKQPKKDSMCLGAIKPTGFQPSKVQPDWSPERLQEYNRMVQIVQEMNNESPESKPSSVEPVPPKDNEEKKVEQGLPSSDPRSNTDAPGNIIPDPSEILSNTVYVAAELYFIKRTGKIISLLMKYFPKLWKFLYVIAILRAIHLKCYLRYLPQHFNHSVLSRLFQDIKLESTSITTLLASLGGMRDEIKDFMIELSKDQTVILLIDGHRYVTTSMIPLVEKGYDSKMRHMTQLNVLFLFSLSPQGNLGVPCYYVILRGSTLDLNGFQQISDEAPDFFRNVLAIGDKGVASKQNFDEIEALCGKYLMPLKRGNKEASSLVFSDPERYAGRFNYHGRGILYNERLTEKGKVFVFYDGHMRADEFDTIVCCQQKEAKASLAIAVKELAKREKAVKETEDSISTNSDSINNVEDRIKACLRALEEPTKNLETALSDLAEASEKQREKQDELSSKNRKGCTLKSIDRAEKSLNAAKRRRQKCANTVNNLQRQCDDLHNELEIAQKSLESLMEDKERLEKQLQDDQEAKRVVEDLIARLNSIIDGTFLDEDNSSANENKSLGTITLTTNDRDMKGPDAFYNYKQRQHIEQFFKTNDVTLGYDVSYMHTAHSEEAWMFLTFLSGVLAFTALNEINSLGLQKEISYRSLMELFSTVLAYQDADGKWLFPHIRTADMNLFKKFNLRLEDLNSEDLFSSFEK